MGTVAVTGIGSVLGSKLLALLDQDPTIDEIVGIDVAKPNIKSNKLHFIQRDPSSHYDVVFADSKADTAIYLGLEDLPGPKGLQRNVERFEAFLKAATVASCKTMTVLSSAMVYGSHADNFEVLYEGSIPRPNSDFGRAAQAIENMSFQYIRTFPTAVLQVIRSALIVGPETLNGLTRALQRKVLIMPRCGALAFQFVHEDDIARAVHALCGSSAMGIFNLAAEGALTIDQIAQLAELRLVRWPTRIVQALSWLAKTIGLKNPPWLAPGAFQHALHPILIANLKIHQEIYFDFLHPSPEAFLEHLLPPEPPDYTAFLEESAEFQIRSFSKAESDNDPVERDPTQPEIATPSTPQLPN